MADRFTVLLRFCCAYTCRVFPHSSSSSFQEDNPHLEGERRALLGFCGAGGMASTSLCLDMRALLPLFPPPLRKKGCEIYCTVPLTTALSGSNNNKGGGKEEGHCFMVHCSTV